MQGVYYNARKLLFPRKRCIGISIKTKKPPLTNKYTARSWFQLKVAYDSSVVRSPGHTSIRQAD